MVDRSSVQDNKGTFFSSSLLCFLLLPDLSTSACLFCCDEWSFYSRWM